MENEEKTEIQAKESNNPASLSKARNEQFERALNPKPLSDARNELEQPAAQAKPVSEQKPAEGNDNKD